MRAAVWIVTAVLSLMPALAQTAPATASSTAPQRIKGSIVGFAAPTLTVKTTKGETIALSLAPNARVIATEKADFAALKPGDFIASTSSAGKDGRLLASELRLFPEPLRGLGEGQYPSSDQKSLINATVSTITPAAKGKGGSLKLTFHGSIPGPNGMCSGHAPAPGQGPCASDNEIVVGPKTMITRWVLGDTSWLEPGKAVSLFAVTDAGGKLSTYGVLVEHNGVKPLP
ncbi:hypothetical protein FHS83_000613 [Rhizomicrobium palustre]|uniref:DUF5666 domain-containing protein n=1 Tax=Rhizomicrobium palustre TaxID=189966 RepID=A0A846MVQ0_9PROT|nr:hypothetical protein [Rhizomicrobium palustre]NIK87295.1 hypothetical protein [Rhizomicrobium palustre]